MEARSNGNAWDYYTLVGIWQSATETRYHVQGGITGYTYTADDCRVPYSCPDPIAELSMAADLLAERGADEAAALLLKAVAAMNECKDIIGKCPLGVYFKTPYLQTDLDTWREYMYRLTLIPDPTINSPANLPSE